MPYPNAAAISRPELNEVLMQAQGAEKLLIADKVLGVFNSKTKHARYPKIEIAGGGLLNLINHDDFRRGKSGAYKEVEREWTWDTCDTEEVGVEERIDDVVAAEMQNFFSMETFVTKNLRKNLMFGYEKKVADLVMSSANSGLTATNGSVAYTEGNVATMDFPRDMNDAIARGARLGVQFDTMVLSRTLYNLIVRSTFLQKYLFGPVTQNGAAHITKDIIADRFGLSKVLIGEAHYNSAGKGIGTASMTSIWGNSTILLAKTGSGAFDNDLGRAIVWTGDANSLYVTESYRDENRRSDMMRVRMHYALKITDSTAGQLISSQYA